MANDAKPSCKVKDNENNSSKEIAGKPSTDSAEASNASGLRKSGRETPSKKIRCPSPPSSRKSDRLEKRTPTPPVVRKSERVEKQSTPNALWRSERGKKQSSSSSSGSKKSNRSLDMSVMKKKLKKEKSVKQLTFETKKISTVEKEVVGPAQMGKNKLDARSYKAIFNQKGRKNVPGIPSKDVDTVKESGEKKVQDLREVSAGKASEESACSVSKHLNGTSENNIGLGSSCSSQNISSAGACQSEDGDSVKDSEGGNGPLLPAYRTLPKELVFDAETAKNNLNSELVNTIFNKTSPDNDVGLESGYQEISLKRKRDKLDPDSDDIAVGSSKDICPSVTDATAVESSKNICPSITAFANGNKLAETCATCFKQQRDNHGSKQQEVCLCGSNPSQIICGAIVSEEGNGAVVTGEVTGKCMNNIKHKDSPEDIPQGGVQNICLTCKLGGNILCCEGKGCEISYHVYCLVPPLEDTPPGAWYCLSCVKKMIRLGAHSVSEGIESIWKVKMSEENGLQKKHFFVKYKGLAHVYNRWVSESLLLLEAPLLVAKFKRQNQVLCWKEEWTEPHRMLQKRLLGSRKQLDDVHKGHVDDVLDCHYQWLVKWRGLDYEKATWELENTPFMKLPKAQSLIRDYENRLERAKKRTHKEIEIEKGSVKPMQLSAGLLTEIENKHMDFINSLRERWNKGQNVAIIDDIERIVKVITFIASLSSDGCWPFLIITSSDASLWDEEFSRLAPSISAVVYHGSKVVRRSIRAVEFYVGGVMFDVLITSPETLVEDLDFIRSINWEAMVVDECQRPRINSHFRQFKSLSTKMRLLLVNCQLKDGIVEHLLPLLDCQSDRTNSDDLITNSDHRNLDLKEKLSKYIIDGSKSDTSRFIEYWVPAQISNPQLEQYCATLLSNSLPLCASSNSRNDPVVALRDIVISNRKGCDHPYITDLLLPGHLTKDLKVTDFLDVGIKASGKLQLLDAMLLEIRNRGLRVLVLFQSSGGSGKDIKIENILEDFVRQRFGDDSYERLDGLVNRQKKQNALSNFNNQKSRFVFLLETRACLPSIKLSSVDTVIIFSSDWNPSNDLRSLQKITLDPQSQQLKIFRLYSSFTVEENALILAKQSKPLDSNLQSISRATTHNLLMWGVSYLFSKLDEFHNCCILDTCGSTSLEAVSHEDTIQDFLTRLTQDAKDYTSSNTSIILKAKQNQGSYSTDFPLPSEQKIQVSDADLPHIFWKKLLGRKPPQWKYTSGLSQSNRKRVLHRDEILDKAEGEGEGVVKRQKVANNTFDQRSAATENEGGLGAVPQCVHQELNSLSTSHLKASNTNHNSNLPSVAHNKSELREVDVAKLGERVDVRDSQKSLHALLKPEIAKLFEILQLPEDVKAMAHSFLEYVMNNHYVIKEPATVLQAFHISLCWTAASMLKHKIHRKESFELAKQHLDFGCRKEEADFVYSMLKCLKTMFLYHRKSLTPAYSPSSLKQKDEKFEDLARGQESNDVHVLSQLGQHALSRETQRIEKKFDKKMTKLLQKQQEETEECKKKYENQKAQLENKKKTEAAVIRLHSSSSMKADKLRELDIECKKNSEELNCQMETDLKNLQKMHIAARENIEQGKESWLQRLITWAKKDFMTEMESASHLKNQNLEMMESMQDREVQLEVPETASTSDCVEILVTGVKSYMLDGEVPLREQDGKAAEAIVNKISNSSDKTTRITQENEDISSGFPEISGAAEFSEARKQHGMEAPSAAPKIADAVKANETSDQLDKGSQSLGRSHGEVVEDETIVNEISKFSERITVVTQENEDSPSGTHEIPGHVEGDETREQQDEEAPSAVPKTAETVKGVTTAAPDEVAEETSAGGEISGVNVLGPTLSTRPIQEDEVILSQNLENDLSLVEGDSSGKDIDGVSAVHNEDNHSQVSSLAHQEECVQQTTSTILQDRVPSAIETLNPLQQFESSVHQDYVAFDQTNTDAPIVDHVLQMPSTDSPNATNLPSASESEHPSRCEGNINIESSTQMAGDQVEHSNQAVSHLPVETHLGVSGMHVSDTRTVPMSSGANNSSTQTGPAPVRIPLGPDPLQNELERIRKETDQIISIHEQTKLQLKSDCEKEIEEIRRKYENKFQEMESDFLSRKKLLDANHSTVLMNKILAQAFRSKCMDIKGSSAPGMQQDMSSSFLQQLLQLSSQPASAHSAAASTLCPAHHSSAPVSAAPPLGPLPQSSTPASAAPTLRPVRQSSPVSGPVRQSSPVSGPVRHSSAPVSAPVHHSSAPISASPNLRPVRQSSLSIPGSRPSLVINSITPPTGNAQKGSEVRAPAPHLQPFRSAAPAIATSSCSPAIGTPNQQVSSNSATNLSTPSQPQLQPQAAVHDVESHVDGDNQRNPKANLGSNTDPAEPFGPCNTNQVVCLSDDD